MAAKKVWYVEVEFKYTWVDSSEELIWEEDGSTALVEASSAEEAKQKVIDDVLANYATFEVDKESFNFTRLCIEQ